MPAAIARKHQLVVVEFDRINYGERGADDHRPEDRCEGHHGEKTARCRRCCPEAQVMKYVSATTDIEDVDQQNDITTSISSSWSFLRSPAVFAQGEFTHQRQWDAFTDPEEAAEKHHHGEGAQDANAQLITRAALLAPALPPATAGRRRPKIPQRRTAQSAMTGRK